MNISDYITGIQHIGIPTGEFDKTLVFYGQLGFETLRTEINAGSKVAFLKLRDCVLEIYEEERINSQVGAINHFALDVNDIDLVYNQMRGAGIKILDADIRELPFWEKGIRFFSIQGINNEIVEFCQIK